MQNIHSAKRSLWTFVILAMIPTVLWAPVNLSPWTPESYPTLSCCQGSFWQPVGGNLSVIQSRRGQPSMFCSDFSVLSTRVEARIRMWDRFNGQVLRGSFVGFALGFQPGDSTNSSADYLLIDWKQADQAGWADVASAWASRRTRRTACMATRSKFSLSVVNKPQTSHFPCSRNWCRVQALSFPLLQESQTFFT